MIFRDLIKDTVWMPGALYDEEQRPRLSILLPTFNRGRSGLFSRCVDSIISQTLGDIELIIVDDASNDGTAIHIAGYMAKDGRISCLRHRENIGLPAVSEYEAYFRARADRVAFAFDDNFFYEDAFERLLEESMRCPDSMIYGYVEVAIIRDAYSDVRRMRLGYDQPLGALYVGNNIANSSVLLPKKIIEDVGFYDPHVALARVCDWDLWRRVARKYEIKHVDVAVGLEDGPINSDSLGNSYPLDSWVTAEWMASHRNESLQPKNISNYDVFEISSDLNIDTQDVLAGLIERHRAVRSWLLPKVNATKKSKHQNGHILIVSMHHDASTSLCFEGLPEEISGCVRIIVRDGGFSIEELARATCVIFVRYVEPFRLWLNAAQAMGVPRYFYLDDNLPLMIETGEIDFEGSDALHPDNLRRELKSFDGVLLTSMPLLEYFQRKMFHDNCNYIPVAWFDQGAIVADREQIIREEVTIAIFGSKHREDGWRILRPALEKIVRDGKKIHLVGHFWSMHNAAFDVLPNGLRITKIAYESLYCQALIKLAKHKPDFLLHLPSATKNHQYKTLHPLLSATLLGAVPILPAVFPYEQAGNAGAAVIINEPENPISWYEGLLFHIDNSSVLDEIRRKNKIFCANNFSGRDSIYLLRKILRKHGGAVSWMEQARRLRELARWTRNSIGTSIPGSRSENANLPNIISSSISLAAHRKAIRYSICGRISSGRNDLWEQVDFAFSELKIFSEISGWRKRGASLELSDSLHEIPYREYVIRLDAGRLDFAQFAISTDGIQVGIIGIELISPQGVIELQRTLELAGLDLRRPVKFDMNGVVVNAPGSWIFRIFAKSIAPVYVYEFINRKFRGLRFGRQNPFMSLRVLAS